MLTNAQVAVAVHSPVDGAQSSKCQNPGGQAQPQKHETAAGQLVARHMCVVLVARKQGDKQWQREEQR